MLLYDIVIKHEPSTLFCSTILPLLTLAKGYLTDRTEC